MQELYEQIQVYLNMDEEISFKEFNDFYKKVLDRLGETHETLEEEMVWKSLFIVENVMSNANGRAKETRGSEAKKYQKMAQRLQLWSNNLGARLAKAGYTEEDVNERFDKMFNEGPPQE
ncbi:hypothetical protein [Halalkalibacterium ligniniphilum]|uniref:hypothetical protein n=1 Tax=Halalkalibacterium ligniniphilum TaxID=1134413 RepID=UPI000348D71F|nr:hypothetical protein [Halalkalibacterium ligniniphilum]